MKKRTMNDLRLKLNLNSTQYLHNLKRDKPEFYKTLKKYAYGRHTNKELWKKLHDMPLGNLTELNRLYQIQKMYEELS